MYDKILVPLDGSDLAENALPYAEELAGTLGCEITLIHVSESRYRKNKRSKKIEVSSVHLTGHVAEQIVDYAAKENNSLIVMTTHGRSGIRRWILGNVAAKVVRATDRPIALIRANLSGPRTHLPKRVQSVD